MGSKAREGKLWGGGSAKSTPAPSTCHPCSCPLAALRLLPVIVLIPLKDTEEYQLLPGAARPGRMLAEHLLGGG